MKNILYGSLSAFLIVLACCAIAFTHHESKPEFKMKIHSDHVYSVKVSSVDEAVDYLIECDSILGAREKEWWEKQRQNRRW